MLKKIVLIGLFIACNLFAFAQQPTKEDLNKQKAQIQKEIDQLNNSLKQVGNDKKKAMRIAALINAKVEARENLINKINKNLKRLEEDIFLNQREIYRLNKELDIQKEKYAQSLVFAYKNRSNYQYLNFLFSSANFNDAVKRITYLKSYRKLRSTEVENINKTQSLIKNNIGLLSVNRGEQKEELVNQNNQLKELESDKKEKDQIVKDLASQEKDIAAQIKKREKERQALNAAINAAIKREIAEAEKREKERLAKLRAADEEKRKRLQAEADAARIAANKAKADADAKAKSDAKTKADADALSKKKDEELRKAEEKVKAVTYEPGTTLSPNKPIVVNGKTRDYNVFEGTPEGMQYSLDFEKNRGNLPWPVHTGVVCGKFGKTQVTQTFAEQHDGIIICLPVGTQVKCVADGEVTLVYNMDEYKSVTVRHGKYLTVYNRLSDVNVVKNQKVSAGTLIGKAAVSDKGDGEFEFRVMSNKNWVNPQPWLRGR